MKTLIVAGALVALAGPALAQGYNPYNLPQAYVAPQTYTMTPLGNSMQVYGPGGYAGSITPLGQNYIVRDNQSNQLGTFSPLGNSWIYQGR